MVIAAKLLGGVVHVPLAEPAECCLHFWVIHRHIFALFSAPVHLLQHV